MSEPLSTGSCGTRCGTHVVPTTAAQPTQGEKGTRGSTSHTHSRQYNLNDKDTLDVPLDETCMRMGGALPPAGHNACLALKYYIRIHRSSAP